MVKILLISDSKEVFNATEKIVNGCFELIWHKYDSLQREQYPSANVVIMHFDPRRVQEGAPLTVVKVKSKVGKTVPILAIINGTPQKIFSVLKAGADDYITMIEDTQEYRQKIENMILWNWYQTKYKPDRI
ncbi:MAG: hypothetical protein MSA26_05580 [Lachnospiraceae bacterium]|nr:hypothetical protein [Lachnospiraceae bacterium]